MSLSETGSVKSGNTPEVVGYDESDKSFIVKSPNGNVVRVSDTFAEIFPMWAGRVLMSTYSQKWALTAAAVATGLVSSVIMSPAAAGIEQLVHADETPDRRVGVLIQIYNRSRFDLKNQMILRIGQCVMTCPTTAAFDGMPDAKRRLKVGRSLRFFGDGFQRKSVVGERKVWKIPVMEGDFTVEDRFGAAEAIAGGNFLILAKDKASGLKAAEEAVDAIRANVKDVVLPFPGGVCRSGSKAGSLKYKLKASTNHPFCPSLKAVVSDSQLSADVNCVYEVVVNGLNVESVSHAVGEGVKAAVGVAGVVKVSAGNYGGKLGPYKVFLKDALGLT